VAPRPPPADDHGYEIDEAEVIYWGRCPACVAAAAAAPRETEKEGAT
jgi:Fur family ferric uptake transcriptional regulator